MLRLVTSVQGDKSGFAILDDGTLDGGGTYGVLAISPTQISVYQPDGNLVVVTTEGDLKNSLGFSCTNCEPDEFGDCDHVFAAKAVLMQEHGLPEY